VARLVAVGEGMGYKELLPQDGTGASTAGTSAGAEQIAVPDQGAVVGRRAVWQEPGRFLLGFERRGRRQGPVGTLTTEE
jgi:hypothetical protein